MTYTLAGKVTLSPAKKVGEEQVERNPPRRTTDKYQTGWNMGRVGEGTKAPLAIESPKEDEFSYTVLKDTR